MLLIAQRVQTGDMDWGSFTVRTALMTGARTEIDKLRAALLDGSTRPHVTVQSYVRSCGDVISIGACRTDDLVMFLDEGAALDRMVNKTDGHGFAAAYWDRMLSYGKRVWVWRQEAGWQ